MFQGQTEPYTTTYSLNMVGILCAPNYDFDFCLNHTEILKFISLLFIFIMLVFFT